MTSRKHTKKKRPMDRQLLKYEQQLKNLIALSSDWYWEQDSDHRFTLLMGEALKEHGVDPLRMIGTRRWDHGGAPLGDEGRWDAHKAMLDVRKPFTDFIYSYTGKQGGVRLLSVSGQPIFDARRRFKGYRGTAKDVTDRVRSERRTIIEHAAVRIVAEATNVTDALTRIIQVICGTLGWACGVRWEVAQDENSIRCADTWGVASREVAGFLATTAQLVLSKEPVGLARSVWLSGEPLWIRDMAADPAFAHMSTALTAGLHGAFAFPIRKGTHVIGVMEFFTRDIHQPDVELLNCVGYVGIQIGQFSARVEAYERLRESEARFRSLTELSSDWYWEMDADLRFTDTSGGNASKSKFHSKHYNGKQRWDLPYIDVPEDTWVKHKADLYARRPFYDLLLKRRMDDGSVGVVNISGVPIFDDSGVFTGYRGIGKDVTEHQTSADRIQYLATHDSLTGLPNRVIFTEMLHNAVASARRYQRSFALLFLDLDRFKNINDTFGHETGDLLLKETTTRLSATLRESDVIARLGGDEFVVLLQEVSDKNHVIVVARKLLSALNKPVVLLGQECRVTASIGISTYPMDAQDEQSLMKNADIAMYRAKEEGRSNFQFYSEQINVHTLERLALETNLRNALESEEFLLHYQAKLDLHTGKITGVEALIRWQHPQLGMVSPAQFIPLAEETGLIVSIGKWVLKTACAQNVAWQREGLPPLCMAVNLSPRQFSDDDLLRDIDMTLHDTGMSAQLLELELTEGMVMQSPERAAGILRKIKALGVRVAIDDFGVGYSSLAHIKRFPIDTIKIDRSFICDIPHDAEDNAITEAIIAMGKTLSLTVVAEGVETKAQQDFLRKHACDEMQGFYLNKPIGAGEFAAFVRQYAGS